MQVNWFQFSDNHFFFNFLFLEIIFQVNILKIPNPRSTRSISDRLCKLIFLIFQNISTLIETSNSSGYVRASASNKTKVKLLVTNRWKFNALSSLRPELAIPNLFQLNPGQAQTYRIHLQGISEICWNLIKIKMYKEHRKNQICQHSILEKKQPSHAPFWVEPEYSGSFRLAKRWIIKK